MYHLLVDIGFKEIEVGFPLASQLEFDFVRHLATTPGLVPDDVQIQVITLCREDAIKRAADALRGIKRVILQTYLPSSDNYRNTILQISEEEWIEQARKMTAYARSITKDSAQSEGTEWTYNFAFEDFSNARVDAVLRCAEAITDAWEPSANRDLMLTLAASMETTGPHVFADQVEYVHQNLSRRDQVRLSVHTHNDRGCAIASAELGALAGADRVEGCLFGNGERAGNMDTVTFALNMRTQGLETGLDMSRMDHIRRTVERITQIPVHPRAPYAGKYCLRAFSGGHQDAILKGVRLRAEAQAAGIETPYFPTWQVPYLPFDPSDTGCTLSDIIGVNSQSGKSAISWILLEKMGVVLAKQQAQEMAAAAKQSSSTVGRMLSTNEICDMYLQRVAT